jgi:two-component system NtrC family sensor kinase
VKPVRSVRSLRRAIPTAVLAISMTMLVIGLWQSTSHRQTLKTLETALRRAPSKGALYDALSRLLIQLQDDASAEAHNQAIATRRTREYGETLKDVKSVINEQGLRCQELTSLGLRNRPVDAKTTTLFTVISDTLQHLSASDPLSDVRVDPIDGLTKRAKTITSFRDKVVKLMDHVRVSSDPAARITEAYSEARDQVRASFWVTGIAALLGAISAGLFHMQLDRSLWVPMREAVSALESVAGRDYGEPIPRKGPNELRQIFASLATIRDRCAAVEDATDREIEDRCNQKVRSERLAGIGLLATGVAHEINNPLTAIVGAADGLAWRVGEVASKMPEGDAEIVKEYLAMIQSEAKRCRAITTKLLDFARGREGEQALYDMTAIVHEVVGMFKHVRAYMSRTIDINRHDPCRAFCNGPEIKQVILNLVANALQATSDGGRLDIRINPSPDVVELVFQDTGSGMSPETLQHIFDPFFSTKGPGQGTGLGLSISSAIVEKHHGTLEATSAGPGKGSTFRLRLPANETAAQSAAERRAA